MNTPDPTHRGTAPVGLSFSLRHADLVAPAAFPCRGRETDSGPGSQAGRGHGSAPPAVVQPGWGFRRWGVSRPGDRRWLPRSIAHCAVASADRRHKPTRWSDRAGFLRRCRCACAALTAEESLSCGLKRPLPCRAASQIGSQASVPGGSGLRRVHTMAYTPAMKFDWDDDKNRSNFERHGIWFEEAQTVWADPHSLEFYDPDHSDDEDRFIRIGCSTRD